MVKPVLESTTYVMQPYVTLGVECESEVKFQKLLRLQSFSANLAEFFMY